MKRIFVVDDEPVNRELLETMLDQLGYASVMASNGLEALTTITPDVDLVLLDAIMPGMSGFEVAQRIRANDVIKDIPIVMVTALNSKEDRLSAVEAGCNDFISKPVDKTELRVRVASLLKVKEAQDAIKLHRDILEEIVQQRTAELQQALQDMTAARQRTYEAQLETIHRLALAAEHRDEDTGTHIYRVSEYCALLGRALGLPAAEVENLRIASPMHDVGKIGISDTILLKPGKHTPEEFEIMKEHAVIGARILGGSTSELLQMGEVITLSHHEKWNGSGYPRSLRGEAIPLWGRILAVADVFDALTSKRPYKPPLDHKQVLAIMQEGRGQHFDPALYDLFIANLDEVHAIQERYGAG